MSFDEDYFKSEEFLEQLETYETAVSNGDRPFMDVDDLVDIADYYTWQGHDEQADQAIDYCLELYPDATLPNVFKARKALAEGDFEKAQDFQDAIENKDDPDYHYLEAEMLIASGQTDEADSYLRAYGKRVDPDEYEDFVRDCANLFIDYDVNEKAYEWMLRSKGEDNDDFKELMARTLFGLGKYQEAERIFNELIDRHPFSTFYWNALTSTQLMNEDYSAAITSSEYAIAIDPKDPEAICNKANGLARLGNFEEALKYYQKYCELEPEDEMGFLRQAACLANQNRFDEALPILRKALALTPKDSPNLWQIYQEMAFCYGAQHKTDQALQMLDKCEKLDCDHIDMYVVRGHILLQNDRVAEAEKAFKRALIESDSSPAILLRIIVSLYDNRYLSACYQMLLKLFEIVEEHYPDFKSGNAYMALCCYDLGRKDEFLKYLRLAVDNDPKETKSVLGYLFPDGMPVSEYVPYLENLLNNTDVNSK